MATPRPHEAMDAQTVADLLGVSSRMLNNYININDLPSQGSGRARTFVWAEVREWYVGYRMQKEMGDGSDGSDGGETDEFISDSDAPAGKENIRQATLRKVRTDADLKQLQLSRLNGEVLPIADIKSKLDIAFGNLGTNLRSLGPKLVNRIEGVKERGKREEIIREELETLARELSTGAFLQLDATPEKTAEILEEVAAAADSPEILPSNVEILRGVAELLVDYDSL